ncbi:hypothetical protein JOD97_004243 [Duganella sp. 1411]|uniref:hypothetical protein n=1 Tax=Duganella sp. 1411 TaxID=2806572 RepID=UPI001AE90F1A|nr:hypothetical protein [Duganella sp. 1411]MBP1206170.1 hypothetical protein [Duganella sp. 1411]
MAAFLRRRPAGLPAKVIMKRLSILLAIAATLSACGGGGGSGAASPNAPATVVDTRPVVDIVPTVGDFYSYRQGLNFTTGEQPVAPTPEATRSYTYAVRQVGNDGSWMETAALATQSSPSTEFHYRSDGSLMATKDQSCSVNYTAVTYLAPKDMKVGAEWSESYSKVDNGNCAYENEAKMTNKAVALETITVNAGTFDTIKIVSTSLPVPFYGYTETHEETVWRDKSTYRLIKSVSRINQVATDGSKTSYIASSELIGYASAKQGRRNLNIERFAGPWAGSYSGAYSGKCEGTVSETGKLDADCGDGLFSVHGDIDVNGKGTFYLTVNGVKGASFSGAFESLFSIGGAWSAGTASGTWRLEHQ